MLIGVGLGLFSSSDGVGVAGRVEIMGVIVFLIASLDGGTKARVAKSIKNTNAIKARIEARAGPSFFREVMKPIPFGL